jgi:xylose isomerase
VRGARHGIGKYGVGLWAFGSLQDRYTTQGYKPPQTLAGSIGQAAMVKNIRGVELTYPGDFSREQVNRARDLLENYELQPVVINVEIFANPKWQKGSLTSSDAQIRHAAIELGRSAVDVAIEIGAKNCLLWPGQDGYDYLFNDYSKKWDWMIDGIRQICEHNKAITVLIEYKPKEPRTHSLLGNVGSSILIAKEVNANNVGLMLDVGHALIAGENPAESISCVSRYNIPLALHFNDSYGTLDDDMIVGSVNFWKYVEFFYQLKRIGYDGWYDIDIFPYRDDPVKAVEQSVAFIDYLRRQVDKNFNEIDTLTEKGDVHSTLEHIRRIFLKEYGDQ